MGHIKKLLGAETIPYRTLTNTAIWGDLCENIHLHYRNIRLDFSEEEFATFRSAMFAIGLNIEEQSTKNNYKEGDPNFLIQATYNQPLTPDSRYYPNRVSLELNRDNTCHFHYRDLRIHMTYEEFRQIANMFKKALNEMDNVEELPYRDLDYPVQVRLDIDQVQPYDAGHLPLDDDKAHRMGIEYVKELIKSGKKIRPILVSPDGQRLDGYKRYMAFKELGYTEIDCIIDPYGKMGGQHGQSFTLEEEGDGEDILCLQSQDYSI